MTYKCPKNQYGNIRYPSDSYTFVGAIWLTDGLIFLGVELLPPFLGRSFRVINKCGMEKNTVCTENVSSIVEYVSGT